MNYAFVCVLVAVFLYPFWNILALSLSTPVGVRSPGLRLFPFTLSLESYRSVLRTDAVFTGYINTIIRTLAGTTISVIVTYCGAYALSKKELPFNGALTIFVLFTLFFDGGLIATYLNIKSLGLMGSRWALILPPATSAWHLIIARSLIMSLPQELEDAALADGARPFAVIFHVALRLSSPILAILALWSAVLHWNSWFDAMMYLSSRDKAVLQLVVREILVGASEATMKGSILSTQETTSETVRAATIIIAIGPIVFVYPFIQRYLVRGMLLGSLKG